MSARRNDSRLVSLASGLALVLAASMARPASANTCLWAGAAGGSWSVAGNWTGCGAVAPQNGDTVEFPGSGGATSTNDIVGLSLVAIQFDSGGNTISGQAITIDGTAIVFHLVNIAGTNAIA